MVLQSDFVFILLDFGLTMMGRGFFWWHEGSSRLIIIVFTMVELSIIEVAILFSEISAETESTCLRSSVGWIFVVFLDELLLLPLGYYIIFLPFRYKNYLSLLHFLDFLPDIFYRLENIVIDYVLFDRSKDFSLHLLGLLFFAY